MNLWSCGLSIRALADAATQTAGAMVSDPHAAERRLLEVLLQLIIIVLIARVVAVLFRKIGQPAVVGEIIAGLLLGPSVLGKIEQLIWGSGHTPISHALFAPEVALVFETLKDLGLVFLLFLIGLEFDFTHLKSSGKAAFSISIAGVIVPFVLGYALAVIIFPFVGRESFEGVLRATDAGSFSLFMGAAMSITALPVLGRMLLEWNIIRTRIGTVAITAAAMEDAIGWILLAAISAAVKSGFEPLATLKMAGMVIAFALLMIFAVRPIAVWFLGRAMSAGKGTLNLNGMAAVLVVVFICAIATSLIGIFAIFGAFLLGAVLSDQKAFRDLITTQMRSFITVLFLPIFFTYTGLKTDVSTLGSLQLWLIAGAVIGAAIVGKFGGCTLAARIGGFSWREAGIIGTLMNTRGLMELIVINVGWSLGVLPRSVFCMLVMMAVLTTVMTTPVLLPLMRGTELEPLMIAGGFARDRREVRRMGVLSVST